ncbi:MAG: hypothetical protein K0Q50_1140 [Vampirovibrio sp.]|jgi:hypothetical protein|nr:hypothetical protein [Vampirovibrio sp.]
MGLSNGFSGSSKVNFILSCDPQVLFFLASYPRYKEEPTGSVGLSVTLPK